MVQRHDQAVLKRRPSNLPSSAQNLPAQDLEPVIRRAVELQEGSARLEEGVSEAQLLRIGAELGLDPATLRRATAEVRSRPGVERGLLVTLAGSRTVRASRFVNRPAARVAADLEGHLCEREFMQVQRRFEDHTRYVRDSSFAASLGRLTRGFARSSHRPLDLPQLDVLASPVDADSCLLELRVDLAGTRGGLVGGLLGSATGASIVWAVVAWATPLADPLMLVGVPLVAGAWAGTRAIFSTVRGSVQEKAEALLDHVEHDTLS